MSPDKEQAQRLADALQKWFPTYGWLNNATRSDKERLAQEAAALLRRWPDGEPVAWLYEARYIDTAWTVCVGLNNPGPEGAYLRGVRPLYTAPPADAERIAALEAENAALRADAERWRYVVTHASWYRHDDGRDRYSRMCVRLPYDADQSCVATRTAAIDAARSKT